MLEPVRKLLDEQLLLCQARLEAGHVTASDRAGGKVGSRRRRRTAAGAEKAELIRLATVHLLRRQQESHEVRRARGEDIRRRRRRAQLGSQPNRRGGRRRASRRLSTGLEEGITATTVMRTTGQPSATVRIWAEGRRKVVGECMIMPAMAGGARAGAMGTTRRAANGKSHWRARARRGRRRTRRWC